MNSVLKGNRSSSPRLVVIWKTTAALVVCVEKQWGPVQSEDTGMGKRRSQGEAGVTGVPGVGPAGQHRDFL